MFTIKLGSLPFVKRWFVKIGVVKLANVGAVNTEEELQNTSEPLIGGIVAEEKDSLFIANVQTLLAEEFSDHKLTIAVMAEKMQMSKRQLQRKFHRNFNNTPSKYLCEYRMNQAVELLSQNTSVKVVSFSVGFTSHSYFCNCFKKQFGATPSEYWHQELS